MVEPRRWRVHPDPEPAPPPRDTRRLARSAAGMLLAVCGPLVAAAGLLFLLGSDTGGASLVPLGLTAAGAVATVAGTAMMLGASRARVREDARPGPRGRPPGPG